MLRKLFAIYDVKAEFFMGPYCYRTIGEAQREFSALANDMNTAVGKNPEDFSLFELGSFDDTSGMVTMDAQPMQVRTGLQAVQSNVVDLNRGNGNAEVQSET